MAITIFFHFHVRASFESVECYHFPISLLRTKECHFDQREKRGYGVRRSPASMRY